MAVYGYARVSSADQSTDLQEQRLKEAGCEVIRKEKVSGKDPRRPRRAGDALGVYQRRRRAGMREARQARTFNARRSQPGARARPKRRNPAHSRTNHFDGWANGQDGADGIGHGGRNGA